MSNKQLMEVLCQSAMYIDLTQKL